MRHQHKVGCIPRPGDSRACSGGYLNGENEREAPAREARGVFEGASMIYGPDDKLSTKVVVSVFLRENSDPDFLERWYSGGDLDVRQDFDIGEQILAFLKLRAPLSTVMTEGIIGCPHEEGVDYPEGNSCPKCPYWAGRDRFTHERIQ